VLSQGGQTYTSLYAQVGEQYEQMVTLFVPEDDSVIAVKDNVVIPKRRGRTRLKVMVQSRDSGQVLAEHHVPVLVSSQPIASVQAFPESLSLTTKEQTAVVELIGLDRDNRRAVLDCAQLVPHFLQQDLLQVEPQS